MTQPSHQGVQQALHRHGNGLTAKNSVALWQSHGPQGSGGWVLRLHGPFETLGEKKL